MHDVNYSCRAHVKFCGITTAEDAHHAAIVGADAIGLVFFAASPRAVNSEIARAIVAELPPFLTKVGLFVNPESDWVQSVLTDVSLDVLQFHGAEPAALCRSFSLPYIKTISMRDTISITSQERHYPDCAAFLLDAYHPDKIGGTGKTFNWDLIPTTSTKPLIIAGGLTAENITGIIDRFRPYAVDVSSGIESAPGNKDPVKMRQFMQQLQCAQYNEK